MANTICTQKSTCLAIETLCQTSKVDHFIHHHRFNFKIKYNRFSVPEQNLDSRFHKNATRKMNIAVHASVPPGDPLPVDPASPGHWKVWIIGTIITILMSFTRGKWGPLLQLKEKIQTTIDEAEQVADIVEEVAEEVEKVAEGVVKHLPEGKLHDAVESVEKVAEDIDKHAQNAEDVLEKVENVEKEVESFIESTARREKNTAFTTDSKDQK
ncbi:uncharacterized protein LOC113848521 [Abrus precatorius]|uniref:Uncharacterized protein LOC113848521 n=1 Tax=Abrus precatorius TaxID=3816 RepID=A0A8B8JR23_ABRPR|nr:uncharacterized protein LOC113848521 [Abrus precatorius]